MAIFKMQAIIILKYAGKYHRQSAQFFFFAVVHSRGHFNRIKRKLYQTQTMSIYIDVRVCITMVSVNFPFVNYCHRYPNDHDNNPIAVKGPEGAR